MDFADLDSAFISAMQKRKVHLRPKIVGLKVERNRFVIPQNFTSDDTQVADGEGEELLNGRAATGAFNGRAWLVRGLISVDNDVNNGMFQGQRAEAVFFFKNRDNADVGNQSVDMGIRYLARKFISMDCQVMNFHSKAEWNDIEFAEFHAAAGHVLQRSNETPIYHSLKGIGTYVHCHQECSNEKDPN